MRKPESSIPTVPHAEEPAGGGRIEARGTVAQGGSARDAPSAAWTAAVAAATLLAIDPKGLGGLWLKAPADPAREKLLAIHRSLLPPAAPVRKLPQTIADARLLGGLDLTATLTAGRPVMERGLLAETDGGALVIPGAERLSPALAGRLALALDAGSVTLERDGFAVRAPACFAVVACDEALSDEEPPPTVLTSRLGLVISLRGVTRDDLAAPAPDAADVAAARARRPDTRIGDDAIEALAEAALKLGVFELRALLHAVTAARASAALAGRALVAEADLALAARLVLGPRATMAPASADDEAADDPAPAPKPDDAPADGSSAEDDGAGNPREMAEKVLEAAAAALPADLLAEVGAGVAARTASRAPGRAGAAKASKRRGRPIGARPGLPENGARLDLVETLRAAAPWQRIRRGGKDPLDPSPLQRGRDQESQSAPRILVRREDFRIQRLKERRKTLTIFAVDASGSAALHRLAEAKGAVELLLAQAYVRRDEVALIAFRGARAELLLPPTRSLARAKRALSGLPGGGGTPLASGLDAAAALADLARRRGDSPTVVLLTDGAANVARDGSGGRARAQEEALAAAKIFNAQGFSAVLIDVSPRPQARAKELAAAMSARYAPLPSADAAALARAAAGGAAAQSR